MRKYYYNGVILPELPKDILAEYPNVFIYKWTNGGKINFMAAPAGYKWFYYSSDSFQQIRIAECTYKTYVYNTVTDAWEFKQDYNDNGRWGVNSATGSVVWSNDDIPNGSATSTDIYFAGSCAILESARLISIEKIEAETGTLTGSAVINDRTSTSGNIIVDLIGASLTGTLTLNFTAPKSDYYVIRMYFTHSGTRDFKYVLNGKTYLKSVVGTSYYSIGTVDFQMYLNEGSNSVLFKGGTTGYAPMFDSFEILEISTNITKYLVRNNDTIYTVTDGALSEITGTLNADLFNNSGVDTIPDGTLLMTLSAPEVLCWTDGDRLPTLTATVQGVPQGTHEIVSDEANVSHHSIYGVEGVDVIASDEATFLLSFDGGMWMVYNGSKWSASDVGMTTSELMAVPTEAWASVINSANNIYNKSVPNGP